MYHGDALDVLKIIPDESVQCCITSPPYWGLRDYGIKEQLGLENDLNEYLGKLSDIFEQVRRVLKAYGTFWLNLGDCYTSGNRSDRDKSLISNSSGLTNRSAGMNRPETAVGLKAKDLVGIPWRMAFLLQSKGWYLRSDIIWAKPNPMPESVKDRPTKSHEYIFLLSKSKNYYYDLEATRNPASEALIRDVFDGYEGESVKDYSQANAQNPSDTKERIIEGYRNRVKREKKRGHRRKHAGFYECWDLMTVDEQRALGSNKKSVWWVATEGYKDAHFATFPRKLIEPCVLAGTRPKDTILDSFAGSGTVAQLAKEYNRKSISIEINEKYLSMQIEGLKQEVINFSGS